MNCCMSRCANQRQARGVTSAASAVCRWVAAAALVVAAMGEGAWAQERASAEADSASERALLRAQQLVGDGRAREGRAVVDSLLAATVPTSPRYAAALFVRGALAPSAAAAEADYRRVAVEYPLSAKAAEALVRLAQLERARGDIAGALRHLERLRTEYAGGSVEPQSHLWVARTLLEAKDIPRGCIALGRAHARVPASDVEFRNQIEYEMRRCEGVDTTDLSGLAPSPRAAAASAASSPSPRSKAPRAVPPPGAGTFTVQVAATKTRAVAERLQKRLIARGYKARIESASGVYRLRVGRFTTHEEAEALDRAMRRRGINGFIAEVTGP
ncbi:MAG: hypothetical protein NVS1B4_19750 [Gemmatimonadaceae bacterium]